MMSCKVEYDHEAQINRRTRKHRWGKKKNLRVVGKNPAAESHKKALNRNFPEPVASLNVKVDREGGLGRPGRTEQPGGRRQTVLRKIAPMAARLIIPPCHWRVSFLGDWSAEEVVSE